MTLKEVLITVAIAVVVNVLLNFKGFCENIDYFKAWLGRDKEHTGRWSEEGYVDKEELGLTSSGFELHLVSHNGYVSGYFTSSEKLGILCEGRWLWWKRQFSKFYTFTYVSGKRVTTGEFTIKIKNGFILEIEGFLENKETIVLAKVSDSSEEDM